MAIYKPAVVSGKRTFVSPKDGASHTAYTVVVKDGERLLGFEMRDCPAPQVGADVDLDILSACEVKRPFVPRA